jgi:hypothetical protein
MIPRCEPFNLAVERGLGRASFTLYRDEVPLTLSTVLLGEQWSEEAWRWVTRRVQEIAPHLADMVAVEMRLDRPEATPWVATLALPGLMSCSPLEVRWIGELEQHVVAMLLGSFN